MYSSMYSLSSINTISFNIIFQNVNFTHPAQHSKNLANAKFGKLIYIPTGEGRHTTCLCTGSNRKFQNSGADAKFAYCTCRDGYEPVPGRWG